VSERKRRAGSVNNSTHGNNGSDSRENTKTFDRLNRLTAPLARSLRQYGGHRHTHSNFNISASAALFAQLGIDRLRRTTGNATCQGHTVTVIHIYGVFVPFAANCVPF
jgi:hypothetical protein